MSWLLGVCTTAILSVD